MNVTICISKQKIQSSLLQYDDKSFQLLKRWSNGKDLIPQSGSGVQILTQTTLVSWATSILRYLNN
jgi:hypothetical protein